MHRSIFIHFFEFKHMSLFPRLFSRVYFVCFLAVLGVVSAPAQEEDAWPIRIKGVVAQAPSSANPLMVELVMTVPSDHHVYSSPDQFFSISVDNLKGLKTPVIDLPETHTIVDSFAMEEGGTASVFGENPVFKVSASIEAGSVQDWALTVSLTYQACSDILCLSPKTETLNFSGVIGDTGPIEVLTGNGEAADVKKTDRGTLAMLGAFTETAQVSGTMGKGPFLDFLKAGRLGARGEKGVLDNLGDRNVVVVILLILLGGVALNLTPCVLPMIPVNLAIIGAGSQAGSKGRGFLLGATYGGAIAIVYGALGLIVTFTSASFGSLNASPWFNLGVAVIFLLLGLAMIGVFNIDLSRLGNGVGTGKMNQGSFGLAAFMGGVAALLAGACVAPIVIAVLVLSGQQFAQGNVLALGYPFLLGVGMGLPWAFAGAGLSFLPKPGVWMTYVKYVFGGFVILMALYYGFLGVRLLQPVDQSKTVTEGWHTAFAPALEESRLTGKPVFIDFWATWCKNCKAMEKTVLKDEEVVTELEQFVRLKFQAESPGSPDVKPIWDYFELKGLPSYIVIKPVSEQVE